MFNLVGSGLLKILKPKPKPDGFRILARASFPKAPSPLRLAHAPRAESRGGATRQPNRTTNRRLSESDRRLFRLDLVCSIFCICDVETCNPTYAFCRPSLPTGFRKQLPYPLPPPSAICSTYKSYLRSFHYECFLARITDRDGLLVKIAALYTPSAAISVALACAHGFAHRC